MLRFNELSIKQPYYQKSIIQSNHDVNYLQDLNIVSKQLNKDKISSNLLRRKINVTTLDKLRLKRHIYICLFYL